MIPLGIAAIAFACAFGGALGGMFLRTIMPERHLTKETEDAVKLGMGMIATLSALVIGLLVASAKGSYDTKAAEVRHFAANLILRASVPGPSAPSDPTTIDRSFAPPMPSCC